MSEDFTGTAPVQDTNAWGAGADFDQSQPQKAVISLVAETQDEAIALLTAAELTLPVQIIIDIGVA